LKPVNYTAIIRRIAQETHTHTWVGITKKRRWLKVRFALELDDLANQGFIKK
jgi:hypothetical protein